MLYSDTMKFPYYIVRFKHFLFCEVIVFLLKFPYYIVRFKLFFPVNAFLTAPGFHTTQYDLNPNYIDIWLNDQKSFHTTQYDLNYFHQKNTVSKNEFPYYIVRFKLKTYIAPQYAKTGFHTTQYDLNYFNSENSIPKVVFPYYIVRFKLIILTYLIHTPFCFHTTQYDLNPHLHRLHRLPSKGFHTTQYDLNLVIAIKILPTTIVSILHSTI